MTKAAQHFGKDLSHFWRSPDTREYVMAVEGIREFRGIKFFETKEYVDALKAIPGITGTAIQAI